LMLFDPFLCSSLPYFSPPVSIGLAVRYIYILHNFVCIPFENIDPLSSLKLFIPFGIFYH
jgi:hypothetical protein